MQALYTPLGEYNARKINKIIAVFPGSLSTTSPQLIMSFEDFSISDPGSSQSLILAVDDNEDNLYLISQLLVDMECCFITAKDGNSAISMAQTYQPKLILLDMMLPDLSGIEVANYLKQAPQTMEISIIAVTAMARGEDKEKFAIAGCDDCITKPYIIEELEAMIRKYIS